MSTQRASMTLNTSRLYALPLIGLIPIVLIGVVGGVYLIGGANPAEWVLPFAVMVGIGAAAFVLLGVGVAAAALIERASIARVLNAPLVRWPQYASDEAWHSAAADQRERTIKATGAAWIPVLIIGIFLGISSAVVFFAMGGSDRGTIGRVLISLALVYLIFGGAVVMRSVLARVSAERRYHAQLQQPAPSVTIGQGGIYHEDRGYASLRWLRDVRYKPRAKNRGARVEFDLFRPATRRTLSQEETYAVSVPAGQEDEAQRLVEQLRASKRL